MDGVVEAASGGRQLVLVSGEPGEGKSFIDMGEIEHALRVTIPKSRKAYVYPATHQAGRTDDENVMRMGERLRLRANFDTSQFTSAAQTILKALKKHGMFVADNGNEWAISIAPEVSPSPEVAASLGASSADGLTHQWATMASARAASLGCWAALEMSHAAVPMSPISAATAPARQLHADVDAGLGRDLRVHVDRVALQRGDVRVVVDRMEPTCGVPARAGGQLGALDEADIGPALERQVVEQARAGDPTADDHDPVRRRHDCASQRVAGPRCETCY